MVISHAWVKVAGDVLDLTVDKQDAWGDDRTLRKAEKNPLAGRMTAVLDLCARLPRATWYEEDAQAHDQRFWPQILSVLKAVACSSLT